MTENNKRKIKINYGKFEIILTVVCALLIFVDLLTKFLEEEYAWNFWKDVKALSWLIYVESGYRNTGAAFSFLADAEWGQAFLIILTCIMLAGLIIAFLLIPNRFKVLKIALVMVIAGAIGNLVDRLSFGEVRDFVWFNIFGNFACCNFADFFIVIGAILAAIDILFLNEIAVIPLTKTAKAAQQAQKEQEQLSKSKPSAAENSKQTQNDNLKDDGE